MHSYIPFKLLQGIQRHMKGGRTSDNQVGHVSKQKTPTNGVAWPSDPDHLLKPLLASSLS